VSGALTRNAGGTGQALLAPTCPSGSDQAGFPLGGCTTWLWAPERELSAAVAVNAAPTMSVHGLLTAVDGDVVLRGQPNEDAAPQATEHRTDVPEGRREANRTDTRGGPRLRLVAGLSARTKHVTDADGGGAVCG